MIFIERPVSCTLLIEKPINLLYNYIDAIPICNTRSFRYKSGLGMIEI